MNDLLTTWWGWMPNLLQGLVLSLQVTAAAVALGVPLGLLLALCATSPYRWLRNVVAVVVELGRGAPVLVMLQFVYFGLPTAGMALTSFAASIVALALSTGAYTSEIIRAGLQSVPAGQLEAAHAIGLNRFDTLRLIVLPQGLRVAVPPLLGFALVMLQASSLCFTIALPEVFSRANNIGSETFMYLQAFVLVGLMYVSVCIPSTWLIGSLEKRMSRHE